MKRERRVLTQPVELRKAEGAAPTLRGYAAVFNTETVIAGLFRERISPGAFADAIQGDDVRALFNHNPDYVLGRNTAGTLALEEDERGLGYEIVPPDTQVARDLMVSVSRGDVNQSSFGFSVQGPDDEEWDFSETERGLLPLRTIKRAKLYDVSPVTYPAYEETTAEARSILSGAVTRQPPDHAALLRRRLQLAEAEGL